MKTRSKPRQWLLAWLLLAVPICASAQSAVPEAGATNRIAGHASDDGSPAADVVVMLCDQRTGFPISADTRKPFAASNDPMETPHILTAMTDDRGAFAFENLPPGEYRMVAQKWSGPFKGVFERHGSVIQLFGWRDHIHLPSTNARPIELRPPGEGVMVFDQDVGNDETFFLLSTAAPQADTILGFYALGTNYLAHAVAVNRMPRGRTTVVGLPEGKVHAFFFAADNSPGFALESFEMRGNYLKAPKVQFVAGWSDGRHEAPPRLKPLVEFLAKNQLQAETLLGFGSLKGDEKDAAVRKNLADLDRKVELPGAEAVTVGDLMAADSYLQLKERKR